MRQEISLILCGQEVEFNQPPEILYNYTLTETANPSVVKNSYSKTITITGTPNNNKLFGHIWNLDRLNNFGTGSFGGVYFNPIQKAEFTLYVNGEVYESGYFKLDEVRKQNHAIEYDITLYGGLGDFFYNLSYVKGSDGTVEGPDKLEIADLKFPYGVDAYLEGHDLDFVITKEAVNTAWNTLIGGSIDRDDKFELINFAPCYNGIPDDFSADKCIINKGTGNLANTLEFGALHYDLGTFPQELTEWQTKDLRSYLQRPVLNVMKVIEACCDPVNNGGYTVHLDPHFFTYDNPYWSEAWMTLPMLRDLDLKPASYQNVTSATIENTYSLNLAYRKVDYPALGMDYNNVRLKTRLKFNPDSPVDANILYTNFYATGTNPVVTYPFIKYYSQAGEIMVQLIAKNEINETVSVSNVYMLSSERAGGQIRGNRWEVFGDHFIKLDGSGVNNYTIMEGHFVKDGDSFVWCNLDGNPVEMTFTLDNDKPFSALYMKISTAAAVDYREHEWLFDWHNSNVSEWGGTVFRTRKTAYYDEPRSKADCMYDSAVYGNVVFDLIDFEASRTDYAGENFYSNRLVDYRSLLSLGVTPCDFLLSYCKLFGLHFYKETDEKVIHILDRNTFFDTNNIVNLEEYIDRSKPMKITPQVAKTKWYEFNLEQVESSVAKEYKESYGQEYGTQRVNTNNNFDADKTTVFSGNIFKGGVEVLEKSEYFRKPKFGYFEPCLSNGMSYEKFDNMGEEPITPNKPVIQETMVASEYLNRSFAGYDAFSKPQFHDKENSSIDGAFVLLFNNYGFFEEDINYWLTDDIQAMKYLNDDEPCWIVTDSEEDSHHAARIAIKRDSIPMFTRMRYYSQTGYITHSWDLGKPQSISVPKAYVTEGMSIYDKVWKNYISDLYDVNDKVLSCYCLLKNKPNPDWLRRFYWFDNSLWRLNKIQDWNISSYETTQMEFVKVQELNNYNLDKIVYYGVVDIYLPDYKAYHVDSTDYEVVRYYNIDPNANTINVAVRVEDGGLWTFGDRGVLVTYEDGNTEIIPFEDCMSQSEGFGNTMITLNLSPSGYDIDKSMKRSFEFSFQDMDVFPHRIVIEQNGTAHFRFVENPININADGGTYTIDFQYKNRDMEDVIKISKPAILAFSEITWDGEYGSLTVTVPPNTGRNRRFICQFSSTLGRFTPVSLDINQSATRGILNVTEIIDNSTDDYVDTIPAEPEEGNQYYVEVYTDNPSGYEVSIDSEWIHQEWKSSSNFYFSVDNNDSVGSRTGHITFTAGSVSVVREVTQAGVGFALPNLDITYPTFPIPESYQTGNFSERVEYPIYVSEGDEISIPIKQTYTARHFGYANENKWWGWAPYPICGEYVEFINPKYIFDYTFDGTTETSEQYGILLDGVLKFKIKGDISKLEESKRYIRIDKKIIDADNDFRVYPYSCNRNYINLNTFIKLIPKVE